jgi:hypothetical protein
MPLLKTVETVARTAVGTAVHVARHPLGAAANVTGFAKGVVGAGVGLVHGDPSSTSAAPTQRESSQRESSQRESGPESRSQDTEAPSTEDQASTEDAGSAEEQPAAAQPAVADEPKIPGPDIVLKPVPTADELPEPIVIYADDEPAPGTGESFQTEPKAGSRISEHEGRPGDREEVDGYVEEVVLPDDPDIDIETPVGTTGADVGFNPSTAESELHQPGTTPLPSTDADEV